MNIGWKSAQNITCSLFVICTLTQLFLSEVINRFLVFLLCQHVACPVSNKQVLCYWYDCFPHGFIDPHWAWMKLLINVLCTPSHIMAPRLHPWWTCWLSLPKMFDRKLHFITDASQSNHLLFKSKFAWTIWLDVAGCRFIKVHQDDACKVRKCRFFNANSDQKYEKQWKWSALPGEDLTSS